MPQYPGGEAELMKFIRENLSYPKGALADSIQGRVILNFVVKSDGSIGDIEVVRGVHPSLDEG